MDAIVWLLRALAFFMFVGAIIVLTIGIVWSPVGALACGIAARKRGLSTARYAMAGAFTSTLIQAKIDPDAAGTPLAATYPDANSRDSVNGLVGYPKVYFPTAPRIYPR